MTSRADYNNPHGAGELGLPYHFEMLSDTSRVNPFKRAIEQTAKGRIVIESGTGTGVLSALAARAGAEHVFAVELDPKVAEFAKANFERLGLSNISIIQKSTLEVTLDDLQGKQPSLVIAENLSTWQATEPQVQVMNHIAGTLATDEAIFLPTVAANYVELADSNFWFYDVVELRTHYFEFTGIKQPSLRSEPALFSRFEFAKENATKYDHAIELIAQSSGKVNSLRLTSPLQVYSEISFHASDSLMPPVVVPLEKDIEVQAGQKVKVHIKYETLTDWERFTCQAEVVG